MFIYFYLFIKNIYIVIPDFKTRCFYDIILFFFLVYLNLQRSC